MLVPVKGAPTAVYSKAVLAQQPAILGPVSQAVRLKSPCAEKESTEVCSGQGQTEPTYQDTACANSFLAAIIDRLGWRRITLSIRIRGPAACQTRGGENPVVVLA